MKILFCAISLLFSHLAYSKTEVFFGTYFTEITPKEMQNELARLGAEKAGKVELGSILRGSPYFHFNLPRATVSDLFTFLNKKGNLIIENSQTSEIDRSEYIRFIIWLAPTKKFSQIASETLFIHRIVNNPDIDSRRLKDFLEENQIRFSGKKVVNFSLSNIKQFDELIQHLNESGSYLLHQNKEWNSKKIRVSFSQSSKVFNKKVTALGLTVVSKNSESTVIKLVDEMGFQKGANKWKIKNTPSNYINLSKNGTLSVIPSAKNSKFADLTISNIFKFNPELPPARPKKVEEAKQPSKKSTAKPPISPTSTDDFLASQEKEKREEAEKQRIKNRDKQYPYVENFGNEKIYLEALPIYTTFLTESTLRGYYEGKSPLKWNQETVETKENHFEVVWKDNKLENPTTGSLTLGGISKNFEVTKYRANEFVLSGSAYQTAAKKVATMSHLEYERSFERTFNAPRNSMLFDQTKLNFSYTMISQAVNGENYQDISLKFKHYFNRPSNLVAKGLISNIEIHNIASGKFTGNLIGAGIEYEMNFPFPLFEYWPKTISPFLQLDIGGPGINITKSFYAGLRGKMYFRNHFYMHGSVGRLEQSIEYVDNFLSTTLSFGLTRFEGGFGYSF